MPNCRRPNRPRNGPDAGALKTVLRCRSGKGGRAAQVIPPLKKSVLRRSSMEEEEEEEEPPTIQA
jgi:hypothetical protein